MTDCRHFTGYKPCSKSPNCNSQCPHLSVPSVRIAFVHLEALGAVLRSTSLLPAIRRKFPKAHITWITRAPAQDLLINNPWIDRILTTSSEDLLKLRALEFDIAFCLDKSLLAAGLLKSLEADLEYGFTCSGSGSIVPISNAANELWELGLDNHKKFKINEKAETQLSCEALELGPFRRDEYQVYLTAQEQAESLKRRQAWKMSASLVVGFNTGSSGAVPFKKMSITNHRDLIEKLIQITDIRVVLLGGREDEVRNQRIGYGLPVVQSPTGRGLRDGLVSVNACDVVVSGDSLGMHMAIGLKKWVVAWFGPTCANEIDLYDRGIKVLSKATCGPCWKQSCEQPILCHDQVDLEAIINAVEAGRNWLASSKKQVSSTTTHELTAF